MAEKPDQIEIVVKVTSKISLWSLIKLTWLTMILTTDAEKILDVLRKGEENGEEKSQA